jgi:hypothetical protein
MVIILKECKKSFQAKAREKLQDMTGRGLMPAVYLRIAGKKTSHEKQIVASELTVCIPLHHMTLCKKRNHSDSVL